MSRQHPVWNTLSLHTLIRLPKRGEKSSPAWTGTLMCWPSDNASADYVTGQLFHASKKCCYNGGQTLFIRKGSEIGVNSGGKEHA